MPHDRAAVPRRPLPGRAGLLALIATVGLVVAGSSLHTGGRGGSGRPADDAVLAASTTASVSTSGSAGAASLVASSPYDGSIRLSTRAPDEGLGAATVAETLTVDAGTPRQPWWGTGAALTDASVAELDGHPDRIARLFAPHAADGARLSWLRLPLTATDLSSSWWGWRGRGDVVHPTGPGRRALAVLRTQILPVAPHLRIVATPWTAPPAWKSPATWEGGRLRDDAVPRYARLLLDQARWLRRHGVPLRALTLANEPGFAGDYPSMVVGDAAMARLRALVEPGLHRLGVRLWGLDHNWSDADRVAAIGGERLDAVAFHCYEGEPADAAGMGIPWLVSECTGTTDAAVPTLDFDARVLVRDAIAAGSRGLFFWNLALPPGARGAGGGCTTCRGLLTVSGGDALPEPEFYVLAHLARAAPPGARVVAVSGPGDVPAAAFVDDGRLGVIALNDTDRTRWLRFTVTGGATSAVYRIGPRELLTFSGPLR